MNPERRTAEIYVGLFLAIGFAVIAVMVVKFGKLGRGFKEFYEITVQFPNASGLVKGADVLMAGARIGNAATDPRTPGARAARHRARPRCLRR
jgi:phospholipid/cholesterol/gamma-HCH transport system substrate-binding protein